MMVLFQSPRFIPLTLQPKQCHSPHTYIPVLECDMIWKWKKMHHIVPLGDSLPGPLVSDICLCIVGSHTVKGANLLSKPIFHILFHIAVQATVRYLPIYLIAPGLFVPIAVIVSNKYFPCCKWYVYVSNIQLVKVWPIRELHSLCRQEVQMLKLVVITGYCTHSTASIIQ